MKRKKRPTKRERKAQAPKPAQTRHIHCIACGRHIDPSEFTASPIRARYISCQHGKTFPVCSACVPAGQQLLSEHNRTGKPVQVAAAWH